MEISNAEHISMSNTFVSNTGESGIAIVNTSYTTLLHAAVNKSRVCMENNKHGIISHVDVEEIRLFGIWNRYATISDITVSNIEYYGLVLVGVQYLIHILLTVY